MLVFFSVLYTYVDHLTVVNIYNQILETRENGMQA